MELRLVPNRARGRRGRAGVTKADECRPRRDTRRARNNRERGPPTGLDFHSTTAPGRGPLYGAPAFAIVRTGRGMRSRPVVNGGTAPSFTPSRVGCWATLTPNGSGVVCRLGHKACTLRAIFVYPIGTIPDWGRGALRRVAAPRPFAAPCCMGAPSRQGTVCAKMQLLQAGGILLSCRR